MSRHLHFPDILNARDLGGLPIKSSGSTVNSGGSTRHGVYVRTANLSELNDDGVQALYDHGVRTIIDLRCAEELRMTPSNIPAHTPFTVHHVPFLGDSMGEWQIRQVDDSDGRGYNGMLDKFQPEVGTIMQTIADVTQGGVLFHCYAGKDRTGLTAMLLLSLADVPDEVIAHDYELSQIGLERMREKQLAREKDPGKHEQIMHEFRCSPHYMHSALNHLRTKYGGTADYLRAIGLSHTAIDQMRQRLIAA